MKKKKIDYAKQFLKEEGSMFRCPTCLSGFKGLDETSLLCPKGHRYNISKKGTIHFPDHPMTTDYDLAMLTHRRQMIMDGLYHPVLEAMIDLLPELGEDSVMIDLGCGEGSFLKQLTDIGHLPGKKMGFDLSKDGVQLASDYSDMAFWFLGDVTSVPVLDERVDVLFNIFSPVQYSEVKRLLKQDGMIVKVIPNEHYLKELRELFYRDNVDKQHYSNEKVYEKFKKELVLVEERNITYRYPISRENYEHVLKMSPVHWGASEESREYAASHYFDALTIDVKILIGKTSGD